MIIEEYVRRGYSALVAGGWNLEESRYFMDL